MANSKEYMKEYMRERWHKRRDKAIAQLGGKCVKCQSTDNLQFDHKDASTKSFPISKFSSMAEVKWQDELSKCQLLCEKCHLDKSIECGDLGDRYRTMICECGKSFESIRSYAGHWFSTAHKLI